MLTKTSARTILIIKLAMFYKILKIINKLTKKMFVVEWERSLISHNPIITIKFLNRFRIGRAEWDSFNKNWRFDNIL